MTMQLLPHRHPQKIPKPTHRQTARVYKQSYPQDYAVLLRWPGRQTLDNPGNRSSIMVSRIVAIWLTTFIFIPKAPLYSLIILHYAEFNKISYHLLRAQTTNWFLLVGIEENSTWAFPDLAPPGSVSY